MKSLNLVTCVHLQEFILCRKVFISAPSPTYIVPGILFSLSHLSLSFSDHTHTHTHTHTHSYTLSRTVHRWNSSLVVKRVFFECFDCFMPLFYIAFYQLDVVTLRAEIASLFMSKPLSFLVLFIELGGCISLSFFCIYLL